MKGGGSVNSLEEIAKIVIRIRDLREKIEEAEDKRSVWLELLEVGSLRVRLEKMKQKLMQTKEA